MCRKTLSKFIEEATIVHNNKYRYNQVNYINNKTKVKILCTTHGIFEQSPIKHLLGRGCPRCKIDNSKFTLEEFIIASNNVHGNIYDYSKVEYIHSKIKVKIICKKHGIFDQVPNCHLQGNGCPHCKISKGENKIRDFLILNNIKFTPQKEFEHCKYKDFLPFDFYLTDYNICIEFQGQHHYKEIKGWGGKDKLELTIKRDCIKKQFCIENKIRYLAIPYFEDSIKILTEFINVH